MSLADANSIKSIETMAITLFSELMNENRSFSGKSTDAWNQARRLEKAQTIDPSGVTSLILLNDFFQSNLKLIEFSAYDIINQTEYYEQHMSRLRALKDCLDDEEIVSYRETFSQNLENALKHYNPDVNVADIDGLYGQLRLDSLLSINKLERHTFFKSSTPWTAKGLKYSDQIFKAWNINSLLCLSDKLPDGLSLCLICDQKIVDSYFVVIVKAGESLSILTDREKWAYPGQSNARRNHRSQLERMDGNWFPYHLLDLIYDESTKKFKSGNSTQDLTPYQPEVDVLGRLKDLGADELAWLIMLFDLCKDMFDTLGEQPHLSYTAGMIASKSSFEEESQKLPIKLDKSILINPLTLEDVLRANIEKHETTWRDLPFFNQWMEDLYADQITDDIIRPPIQLPDDSAVLMIDLNDQGTPCSKEISMNTSRMGDRRTTISTLNPTTFGTKDNILSDMRYLARSNLAAAIQCLLNNDYEKHKTEMLDWFKEAVSNNQDALLGKIATLDNDFLEVVSDEEPKQFSDRVGGQRRRYAITRMRHTAKHLPFGMHKPLCLLSNLEGDRYKCAINPDTNATLFVHLKAHSAIDIRTLTGVPIDQIPVFLRHYKMTGYNGNSILDRLDPVDERVLNPFDSLNLNIVIGFSKTGFNKLRAAHGLQRLNSFNEFFHKKEK